MSHAQKIEEQAKKRREDMSQEARERLEKVNEEADDWFATCPQCGEKLKGTLAKIRGHSCAGPG